MAVWRPLGVVWGSILGSFWAPGHVMPFLQKVAPRHSESKIFRGSGDPKMSPKLPAATWLQERLGSFWGSIFEHFEVYFGAPKSVHFWYRLSIDLGAPK